MDENYYKNKATVAEYIKLAKDIDGGSLIKTLLKFLPENSTLLELGSGPGTDWRILSKYYSTTGSDYSKEFLRHLSAHNPHGKFVELDAVSLDITEKFDGIYSNKVLHHLTNEELRTSIKSSCKILNPKGIVCHSFWKGEGSEIFNGLYVNYHTSQSLKELFSKQYDVLVLESYAEFDESDSLLLIAQRK